MEQQNRDTFKKLMMELRQNLIQNKTKAPPDKQRILDVKLCRPRFQKLLFEKFYFMYLWRVAREERKVLEKSQDNLKKCFTIVSQVFKVNIKILNFAKGKGFRKTAEFNFPSQKDPNPTTIFLLYYRQVFIQLNPIVKVPDWKEYTVPLKSSIVNANSQSISTWIQFSSKAHVNEQIEKQALIGEPKKPDSKEEKKVVSKRPIQEQSKGATDSDDSNNNLANDNDSDDEDAKDDDDDDEQKQDWDDRPSQKPVLQKKSPVQRKPSPSKKKPHFINQESISQKPKKKPKHQEEEKTQGIAQKDLKMFEMFLEQVFSKIMLSFTKLKDEDTKNKIFEKINSCFEQVKRKSFDSQVLRRFYKKIRSKINQELEN